MLLLFGLDQAAGAPNQVIKGQPAGSWGGRLSSVSCFSAFGAFCRAGGGKEERAAQHVFRDDCRLVWELDQSATEALQRAGGCLQSQGVQQGGGTAVLGFFWLFFMGGGHRLVVVKQKLLYSRLLRLEVHSVC